MKQVKFNDYNLQEEILKSLDLLGYDYLTEVQQETIDKALEGKDIVCKSETGSGKTLAFAVPISNKIIWEESEPQALILTPTRELAMQISKEFFNVGRLKRLSVVEVFGKSPFYNQEMELKQKTHVVVGTPGRVIDHIERGTLEVSNIKYLVIDESDEMLNMGFLDQVETIINKMPKNKQTMLFSATMPEDVEKLCFRYLQKPEYIEIDSSDNVLDRIIEESYIVDKDLKLKLLNEILIVENPDRAVMFCNTREEVDSLFEFLDEKKYSVDKIHGGMEQIERTRAMNRYKKGDFRYLIATDVASRGIDVDDITHVINYDIPRESEIYVHRIGRTARVDKKGKAITLYSVYEDKYIKQIENDLNTRIQKKERPSKNEVERNYNSFIDKMNKNPKATKNIAKELNEDIFKIHISSGKKNKMRPGDIVGAICSIDGVSAEDIGIINIIDTASFVEILNNKGNKVLTALQKTPIKGKMRTVSKARA